MKIATGTALLGLLVFSLGGACSKGQNVRSPAEMQPATPAQSPPDTSVWAPSWDAVSEGGQAFAQAGEWSLEKAKDGAIVVWRTTQRVAGHTVEASDAAVLAEVKSRLAADPNIDANRIDVDVSHGDVVLRGNVLSRAEAADAIRTTLSTQGVDRVTSYVTWPR